MLQQFYGLLRYKVFGSPIFTVGSDNGDGQYSESHPACFAVFKAIVGPFNVMQPFLTCPHYIRL